MAHTSGTLGVPFSFEPLAPALPALDAFWQLARKLGVIASLRAERSETEEFGFSSAVLNPVSLSRDQGAMVTAWHGAGCGYAASSSFALQSLLAALELAAARAQLVARSALFQNLEWPRPQAPGAGQAASAAASTKPLPDRRQLIDMLRSESAAAHAQSAVVGSSFALSLQRKAQTLWFDGQCLSCGEHQFSEIHARVTVAVGHETQSRSLGGGICQQGGLEVLERSGLRGCGEILADEARQLAMAPSCPTGRTALLLMPDQMMLQIHESIGHPLELDRILGDERNYAGTSFVSLDMFGGYRYGSELLNISYDPATHGEELASFDRDDDGYLARKTMLIEGGILKRPLGSALSIQRAAASGYTLEGVANARACGWHRASIDRMANLNLEPGQSSLDEMIAGIDQGVMMSTNQSWSIDDSRNKFQFGCEWAQMIRHGKLAEVVRNPGYRGISANFWRSLTAVGNQQTYAVMGTANCGKGEPGQAVRVGHAAPACVFHDVEVFGGAS